MKRCLGAVAGLLLLGIACGDLSEMSDDELRAFVQRAKRVAIEELLAGGNTQADVDNVIKIVAEELSSNGGDGSAPTNPSTSTCREIGRKTVVMFRDPAGHALDLLLDSSGFSCDFTGSSTTCTDGDGVCECEADDTLNPAGNTSYAATCTENSGDGQTFNFSEAETREYDNPGGSTTPIGGNNPGTYVIKEGNQNQRRPGEIFPITITDSRGTTVTPSSQASLDVYNSSNSVINDAIATWKTAVGSDIYDVSVGANERAAFDIFLVTGTTNVAKIGGTVDGTPTDKYTLAAGNFTGASDVLVHKASSNRLVFMFSGTALRELNANNKTLSYVVTDANGTVTAYGNNTSLSGGITVQGTYAQYVNGACTTGAYILIKVGNSASKVYLPTCADAP